MVLRLIHTHILTANPSTVQPREGSKIQTLMSALFSLYLPLPRVFAIGVVASQPRKVLFTYLYVVANRLKVINNKSMMIYRIKSLSSPFP